MWRVCVSMGRCNGSTGQLINSTGVVLRVYCSPNQPEGRNKKNTTVKVRENEMAKDGISMEFRPCLNGPKF